MSNDAFSASMSEFLSFATTFNAGVLTHATLLGIPATLVSDNTAKLSAYNAAYFAAEASNAGKVDREDRKLKRKDLAQNMRKIKNAYIDADPLDVVSSEILLDFGLPPKDTIRTDVPKPTTVVTFSLETGDYLQVIVVHPAKPSRYNGAVAFYKVGGPVPTDHSELTSSKLLTRTREILTFNNTQLGQTLYISLSWENAKGELGPPSPIQSRVIA